MITMNGIRRTAMQAKDAIDGGANRGIDIRRQEWLIGSATRGTRTHKHTHCQETHLYTQL